MSETYRDGEKEVSGLEFAVTSHYLSLIEERGNDPAGRADPIRKQCIPRESEYIELDYESRDPLAEERFSPFPRMVHRYSDRVLVLTTDECAVYCRHCFRRHFSGGKRGALRREEAKRIGDYLSEHSEVKEVILSGGDPLTIDDNRLGDLMESIRDRRSDIVFRLASRVPVVLPQRITAELVELLASYSPLFFLTQFNHPREISSESAAAVEALIDRGIPVHNQTVLLRGINDDREVLEELFHRLVGLRIFPYYLFQGDLAAGTSHFRVSLERGRQLVSELRRRLSGFAMPTYAVDLPGGGGKIPLTESYFLGKGPKGNYLFTSPDGGEYSYPDEG